MPLKRTPPTAPVQICTDKSDSADIYHASSALNQNTSDREQTSTRMKRKRDDSLSSFMAEIRDLLNSSNAKYESKLADLQSSISEIIMQNTEIKCSLEFISNKYDDLNKKVQDMESEKKVNRAYMDRLEEKVEVLERSLNLSKIEIKNLPKLQEENKDSLRAIVVKTAQALDVDIGDRDIKDVYRTGPSAVQPKGIVVEFTCTNSKEAIMRGFRMFNKTQKNKLNTTDIGLTEKYNPIYISEYLTPKAKRLYYLARNFGKEYSYKHVWTSFGKIYIRKDDNLSKFMITNERDIEQLRKSI